MASGCLLCRPATPATPRTSCRLPTANCQHSVAPPAMIQPAGSCSWEGSNKLQPSSSTQPMTSSTFDSLLSPAAYNQIVHPTRRNHKPKALRANSDTTAERARCELQSAVVSRNGPLLWGKAASSRRLTRSRATAPHQRHRCATVSRRCHSANAVSGRLVLRDWRSTVCLCLVSRFRARAFFKTRREPPTRPIDDAAVIT